MSDNNYIISTNNKQMQLDVIHDFITNSYWARGIPFETMAKAVKNSLCFGVFTDNDKQVGFARLITDKATYAYLADVFILPEHQGQGLAKQLMERIIAHKDLQGLRRISLATHDAHSLYERYGFKPLATPEIFMELWQPEVYKTIK